MWSTQGCGVPKSPVVILPRPTTIAPVSVATSIKMRRAELARVPEAVAENQPAFGVGVVHFDGEAGRAGENVAGLDRLAARHVLGHRHDRDRANRQLLQRDRSQRGDDRRAAGHVVLHPLHAVGRLQREAAGIERDAFADEAERLLRRGAGRVNT